MDHTSIPEHDDWQTALSVAALHDALKESEVTRQNLIKALKVVRSAKASNEAEIEALRKRERRALESRSKVEERLQVAESQIEHLEDLLEDCRYGSPVRGGRSPTTSFAYPPSPSWPLEQTDVDDDDRQEGVPHPAVANGRGGDEQRQSRRTSRSSVYHPVITAASAGEIEEMGRSREKTGTQTSDLSVYPTSGPISRPLTTSLTVTCGCPCATTRRGSSEETRFLSQEEGRGGEGAAVPEAEVIKEGLEDMTEENDRLRSEFMELHRQLSIVEQELVDRVEGYQQQLQRKGLLRLMAVRSRSKEIAFRRWVTVVMMKSRDDMHWALRQRDASIKALAKKRRQDFLATIIKAWQGETRRRIMTRRILARLLGRKRYILQANFMRIWRAAVSNGKTRDLEIRLGQTASRIRQNLGAKFESINTKRLNKRVFDEWKREVQERRKKKQQLCRWIVQRARDMLTDGMTKWSAVANSMTKNQTLMNKVMRRICYSNLHRGFQHWLRVTQAAEDFEVHTLQEENTINRKHVALRMMNRVHTRLQRKFVGNLLKRWTNVVRAQDRIMVKRTKDAILQRTMAHFRATTTSKCFNTWKEYVQLRCLLKKTLTRLFGSKRLTTLTLAMRLWQKMTSTLYRQQKLVGRILARVDRMAVTKGWRSWKLFVVADRTEDITRKRREAIVARFVRLWKSRAAIAAWRSWEEYVERRKSLRQLMTRLVGGWRMGLMAGAWRTWNRFVQYDQITRLQASKDQAVREIAKKQQLDLLSKMSGKLKEDAERQRDMRLTYRQFMAWARWTYDMRKTRAIVRKYLTRRAKMICADVMTKWKAVSAHLDKRRVMMVKTIQRLCNSRLSSAFQVWATAYQAKVQHDQSVRIVCRVLKRLEHRALASTWRRWISYLRYHDRLAVEEHRSAIQHQQDMMARQQEALRRRAAKRLLLISMVRSFNSWREYVDLRQLLRRTLTRLFGGRRLAMLAFAMNVWQEKVDGINRQRELVTKILARIDRMAVNKAWRSWHLFLVEDREGQKINVAVQKFARIWKERRAASAFRSWQEFVEMRSEARNLVNRLFGGKRLALMGVAWQTWIAKVMHLKHVETLFTKVLERAGKGLLAQAFDQLKLVVDEVNEEQRRAKVLARFVGYMNSNLLQARFRDWAKYSKGRSERRRWKRREEQFGQVTDGLKARLEELEGIEKMVKIMVAKGDNKTLQTCRTCVMQWQNLEKAAWFRRWASMTIGAKRVMMFLQRCNNRLMTSTFATWRSYVVQCKSMRKALQLIDGQGLRLQGTAFRTWLSWSNEQEHNQRIIANALARLKHGTIVKIWAAWSSFAKESKECRKVLTRRFLQAANGRMNQAWHRWIATIASDRALEERVKARLEKVVAKFDEGRLSQVCKRLALMTWVERTGIREALPETTYAMASDLSSCAFSTAKEDELAMASSHTSRRLRTAAMEGGHSSRRLSENAVEDGHALSASHTSHVTTTTAAEKDDLAMSSSEHASRVTAPTAEETDDAMTRVISTAKENCDALLPGHAPHLDITADRDALFLCDASFRGHALRPDITADGDAQAMSSSEVTSRSNSAAHQDGSAMSLVDTSRSATTATSEPVSRVTTTAKDSDFYASGSSSDITSSTGRRASICRTYALSADPPLHSVTADAALVAEEEEEDDAALIQRVLYCARTYASALVGCQNFQALFRMVAKHLPSLVQGAHCLLLVVDQAQKELWTREREGVLDEEIRFTLGLGLTGQAVMTGSVVHVKNARINPHFYAPIDALAVERDEGANHRASLCAHHHLGLDDSKAAAGNHKNEVQQAAFLEIVCLPVLSAHGRILAVLQIVKQRQLRHGSEECFGPRHLLVLQLCSALVSAAIYRLVVQAEQEQSEQQSHQLEPLLERLREWLRHEQYESSRCSSISTSSSSSSSSLPSSSRTSSKTRHGGTYVDAHHNESRSLEMLVERVLDMSIRLRQSNARVRDKLRSAPNSPNRTSSSSRQSRCPVLVVKEEDDDTLRTPPPRRHSTSATATPPTTVSTSSFRHRKAKAHTSSSRRRSKTSQDQSFRSAVDDQQQQVEALAQLLKRSTRLAAIEDLFFVPSAANDTSDFAREQTEEEEGQLEAALLELLSHQEAF